MGCNLGIALDLGTSGFRAQALDLSTRAVIATALSTRHPLPGANVIDHLHFALELGLETAQQGVLYAVNQVLAGLHIPRQAVDRLAVCGNPIQLSLFQGSELRDLAYAGERKLQLLGVPPVERRAVVLAAAGLPGLDLPPGCQVVIPPAVRHEVGADALALLLQTGLIEKNQTALAVDYGTNAEMALFHQGKVYTGSAAAGPALEGQHIRCGMLAVPGAIVDLAPQPPYFRLRVLDAHMRPGAGPLLDLSDGRLVEAGRLPPLGITGTGVIAILSEAAQAGLVRLPHITTPGRALQLSPGIQFSEADLGEAGKAVGAIRAGYLTLCHAAGIALQDIQAVYMAGATGTYVNARKAQRVGLLPPGVKTVYQVGNTSLAMARELVTGPHHLERMSALADALRQSHCMFAASQPFAKMYVLELSYWTEGMPLSFYRAFLEKYGFPDLPPVGASPSVIRTAERDIPDFGRQGLSLVAEVGKLARVAFQGCSACLECVRACPESALREDPGARPAGLILDPSRCNGMACRRCERICPEKVFDLNRGLS